MRLVPTGRLVVPLCALAVLAPACDRVSPVAPSGSTLSITANPAEIGAEGESDISVLALRANGTPVTPGTQIRLSTTLGQIDSVVKTDQDGAADAVLRGDGRIGVAVVTARSGAIESASVEVEIGRPASSISVQASPASVPEGGGEIDLIAIVRDRQGQSLQGAEVNFQADIGTLASAGSVQATNDLGQVRDLLTVTRAELATITADRFRVGAQVGGPDGALLEAQFEVRIQRVRPQASFIAHSAGGNRVFFENTTTGDEPLEFQWDFTNNGTIDSTVRNPTFDYGDPGTYTARLVASNPAGSDTTTRQIQVPIQD